MTTSTLEAAAFHDIRPKAYLERFLSSSVRPDGRPLHGTRRATLTRGACRAADGSSLVRLGDTAVACGVRAEAAVQMPDGADVAEGGRVVVRVDVSSVASGEVLMGRVGERGLRATQSVQRVVDRCGFVDLKALYSEDARAAWVLYADVHCINDAGCVHDASVLAVYAALCDTMLPELKFSEEHRVVVDSSQCRSPLPITGNAAIPLSFSLFTGGGVLSDPNAEEEKYADANIVVTCKVTSDMVDEYKANNEYDMTEDITLLAVSKPGGVAVNESVLETCVTRAKQRAATLAEKLFV